MGAKTVAPYVAFETLQRGGIVGGRHCHGDSWMHLERIPKASGTRQDASEGVSGPSGNFGRLRKDRLDKNMQPSESICAIHYDVVDKCQNVH